MKKLIYLLFIICFSLPLYGEEINTIASGNPPTKNQDMITIQKLKDYGVIEKNRNTKDLNEPITAMEAFSADIKSIKFVDGREFVRDKNSRKFFKKQVDSTEKELKYKDSEIIKKIDELQFNTIVWVLIAGTLGIIF